MKTILVPTDYSNEARKAFIYARELAKITNSDIVLFHAFHQPISIANAYHVEETILGLERGQNNLLEEWAINVQKDLAKDFFWKFTSPQDNDSAKQTTLIRTKSGFHTIEMPLEQDNEVRITYICKFGLANEEIEKAAETYKADLILLSTRGVGAVSQVLLGSTVAAVIASSQVPVLILPQHVEFKKPQSLVFAFDLKKSPNNGGLELLRTIVNLFGADLQVLHLYQDNDWDLEQDKVIEGLDTLDIHLPDVSYTVNFRQREDIVEGIHEFVQQQQADLLVLAPKKHTFLELLLNKSVTEKITKHCFVPFLTLPSHKQPATATIKTEEVKVDRK